ncbi:sulfurtransferase complex subunit TusC [Vibrio sp. D420a]|uniref:sulfurtransferase complex subunit TusC n=1 Tax=Vibrio sp. D420a TaxID=2836895 RepID=UPI00255512A8|nr:sulfurtransferase complex subunit TusC [Vibrio sp. D420a]MDK9762656.1 sulfurtransferase complex subunit TusC [Vibrio sp. D420a]
MKKLGYVFNSFPHSTASGREGLDALLAASAYTEEISVFFVGNGVTQLLEQQRPGESLSRDYIAAFKLMELYDIEQVYVCEQSLQRFGLSSEQLVIDTQVLAPSAMAQQFAQCDQILTF